MANLNGFDASQVPEQEEFSAIPEGQYVVIATASEMKPTKNGAGEYLQFIFEIIDGQHKGRKLWARLNLNNQNQIARDIAQRELAAICKAVGIIKPMDSAELHNKPLLATVAVELDDRRKERNEIKKYEPIATQQPMYAPAAAQAPAAAPAAAANTPPWGKK